MIRHRVLPKITKLVRVALSISDDNSNEIISAQGIPVSSILKTTRHQKCVSKIDSEVHLGMGWGQPGRSRSFVFLFMG